MKTNKTKAAPNAALSTIKIDETKMSTARDGPNLGARLARLFACRLSASVRDTGTPPLDAFYHIINYKDREGRRTFYGLRRFAPERSPDGTTARDI